MPKPKKEIKKDDKKDEESPDEYKSDGELTEALGDDIIEAIIPTDGNTFNPEVLGIDKDMDTFDDHDLF